MKASSVLFVDSRVTDYQALLTGLSGDVEEYVLNALPNGIAQNFRFRLDK